jgi:major membrane immunogen (membrane-anchored lipoprotein)
MRTLTVMLMGAALLTGCGEKAQTVGDYRGKADAKPYEANYGSDKAKWESALRARNQNQNEYKRVQ